MATRFPSEEHCRARLTEVRWPEGYLCPRCGGRKTWRIAGINFDHFHMGDLLRYASEHSQVELVGISDEQPQRMEEALRKLRLPRDRAFTDYRACLESTRPDVVILCPAASRHGEWVRKVAPYGPHLLVEKPFAASLKEADGMVRAMPRGSTLMINWPLQWVGSHRKAFELVASGKLKVVGAVYDISTGKVDFLGEHPWQGELLGALKAKTDSATADAEKH